MMDVRLIAYARDSGGRDQQLSTAQQLEGIGEWCRERGYLLTREFVDQARSGTSTAGREQFQSMMDYLAGVVPERGVVLWEYSRLARDYDDATFYIADLRRRGYEVYSVTDQIPEGLTGRLLESVLAWKNAVYSEDLSRNVRRGHRYYVEHLRGHAGNPPIGYRAEKVEVGTKRDGSPHVISRLVPDEERAPLVRLAFEMRADGATLAEIHAATGLADWVVVYSKLLSNPIYKGTYRYGGQDYPDHCPAIVDAELWERAQAVNVERRERHGYNHPRRVRSRFALTGLAVCGHCGLLLHGRMTRQRAPYNQVYDYYVCSSENGQRCGMPGIPREELEGRVIGLLLDEVLTPAVVGEIMAEVGRQAEQVVARRRMAIERLAAERREVSSRIERLVAAIGAAGHSRALIEELGALEKRLGELDGDMARAEVPAATVVPAVDVVAVRAALLGASDVERGAVLRGFVREVRAVKRAGRYGVLEGVMVVTVGGVERVVSF